MADLGEEYEAQKAAILAESLEVDRQIDQDRERRSRQLVQVLAIVPNPGDSPLAPDIMGTWERLGVPMNRQGNVAATIDNAARALHGLPEFKGFVWYDEFYAKYLTTWKATQLEKTAPREWQDSDDLELQLYFQRSLGLIRATDRMANHAMRLFACRDVRNEPRDWLKTLQWDGVARIGTFFADYMGAHPGLYTASVSENFWTGMAARIYRPGCKLDNMVVLYGGQGIFKSTSIALIGGKWATELHSSLTNKDFYLDLQGKIICEISELGSFKNSDLAAIKAAISRPTDRLRAPYAKASADFPRSCVFVGTTNDPQFLKDDTGGRRFWPITVGKIDRDKIEKDREQLFAEAVARFKTGAPWYRIPQDAAEAVQESHRQADDWEEPIQDWLTGKMEAASFEIAEKCLMVPMGKVDQVVSRRICRILVRLGWKKVPLWRDGKTVKRWVLPTNDKI